MPSRVGHAAAEWGAQQRGGEEDVGVRGLVLLGLHRQGLDGLDGGICGGSWRDGASDGIGVGGSRQIPAQTENTVWQKQRFRAKQNPGVSHISPTTTWAAGGGAGSDARDSHLVRAR